MFHINEKGPAECKARKKECPLGGQHFKDMPAAQEFYEKEHSDKTIAAAQSKVIATSSHVVRDSYLSSPIDENSIKTHLQKWKDIVGHEEAKELEQKKFERDKGREFHMTILSPKEFRTLKKEHGHVKSIPHVDVKILGVGKASNDESTAWYLVVDSDSVNSYRQSLGLPPKDLHITLGFDSKDVHDKPKGKETIISD